MICRKIIPFLLLLPFAIHPAAYGQQCDQWPADCPDEGSITASQDPAVRQRNGLLPQEIDMQDRMRALFTGMMRQASKKLGWQLVELDETTNLNPFQRAGTAYPLRSPRAFDISFEFIISDDSIARWKDWLMDFSRRYAKMGQDALQQQKDVYNSTAFKQCYDSVNRYIKLASDYLTAHQDEGANLFEDKELVRLQQKQKEYSDKLQQLTENPAASSDVTTMEQEKSLRTRQFRNASLVEVYFSVNETVGIIHDDDFKFGVRNYPVPAVPIGRAVHFPSPDVNTLNWHFTRWEDMVVLLLGNWLPNSDLTANVQAGFSVKGQADEKTPKKILSDKVQNVAIHVSGNPENIGKLVHQLDITKLNDAIGGNN